MRPRSGEWASEAGACTLCLSAVTAWYECNKFSVVAEGLAWGVMLIPYRDYGGVLLPENHILWDEYPPAPIYSIDDCLPPAPNTALDG